MIDNQWPKFTSGFKIESLDLNFESYLVSEIEKFFNLKYNFPVLLFPSARSAISAILNSDGINRVHTVYAPKFSSHCVWDIITRYSNPSTSLSGSDVFVVSHKWGSITKFGTNIKTLPQLIIEDSVDSFLIDNSSLFPNNGHYEILSLPKILGTLSGGVVICKDQFYYEKLKNERDEHFDVNFSKEQSALKAQKDNSWMDNEYKNRRMFNFELQIIKNQIDNWSRFEELLIDRFNRVKYLAKYNLEKNRIPPLIFIDNVIEGLMIRNFDMNQNANNPNYKTGSLLPIHVCIGNDEFESYLKKITKN